jgi:hypothetical protein
MANPNPPTEHLKATQFKPGHVGNPGGMTAALRAQIDANAAEATRIRTAMLAKLASLIDPDTGEFMGNIKEAHPVVTTSEDRGLGAPKQTLEAEVGLSQITRRIMEKP